MSATDIRLVKYVFLDVVAYTKRTIEAQCDIIAALNGIVKDTLRELNIAFVSDFPIPVITPEDSAICIPTGDGICIALVNPDLPYDIHMTVAQHILRRISIHNQQQENDDDKFGVRIGINQSDDNIIRDINDKKNVTGGGINNARRIMDLGDENQILVSRVVYEALHQRQAYVNAFKRYVAEVKHGLTLEVYQFVKKDIEGLDVAAPSRFVTRLEPEPKLSKLSAYYFAHLIKNESFILKVARSQRTDITLLRMLIWFLASNSERESQIGPYDIYRTGIMPDECHDTTIEGQLKWFRDNVTFDVALYVADVLQDNAVPSSIQDEYLEITSDYLVVKSGGKEKLRTDWPKIWDEFGLSEVSG